MSSLLVETRGAPRPRNLHQPSGRVATSGTDVAEFAESAGLILDDWQRWVLDEALAERADGLWAAFEVALIVPRQNGKGSILEALEIYHLFVLQSRLIVHSAHEFKTAREHFLRMQALIKGAPELYEQVGPGSGGFIHTGAGSESIGTADGSRLNFVARSRGSGRGFSGDLVVLDEAYKLPVEAVGAMGPALSAMPNPQVWYTSSAPHADSEVLHGVLKRGMAGEGNRLFLAEWGNEPGVDIEDNEAIAYANPAAGDRLPWANIDAEREMLRELGDEFARERLGVPSAPDMGAGVFPTGTWAACTDGHSKVDPQTAAFALDVAPGMTFASFAFAAKRADGLIHLELAERHPGTDWVVPAAAAHGKPIALDPRGPAGSLMKDLTAAGVTVVELPDGQMPRSCVTLQKLVIEGNARKLAQAPLDAAVAGAAISPSGDAWRWSRSHSSVDISPLVAVTVALWHLQNVKSAPNVWNLDELLAEEV